ncbi:hypothetical protein DFJ73DRAFT_862078 [Zopfochytrium polystomum]|nr:hypothetical protein DFJ73DRAFT_862078 [Zopfochytrium polystomum]
MTFFERKGIWKSLLELDDQKRESGKPPSLDDAAAVARFLGAEEEVRPVLHGVLSVKIRTATLIKFDRFSARPTSSQCQISIRNVTKKTRLVEDQQGTLRWDQIKHFPICVVRNFRHPYNLLKIELSVFESASSMDGYVVGSIFFHLHDIIKANPIAGTFDLWDENFQVGDIGLELTFTYGHFGYGYSHQLQEDDTNSIETVQYSLLPRITPRRDQREPEESVMVVCATPHPSFLPFKEKAYLSYGKDIRKALEEAEEAAYDPDYFRKELGSFDAARDEVSVDRIWIRLQRLISLFPNTVLFHA